MANNIQTKTRMTAEEYFALPETTRRQELIHGELITYGDDAMSPAPKDIHEEITMMIVALLMKFVPVRELRTAPTDVHIDRQNVVQPDVFWVNSKSGQCVRYEDGYLHGAPDLIVEILSSGTEKRDRNTKYDLYEKHGVREYWIVDVGMKLVEVYTRQDDKFSRHGVFGADDTLVSPVLDGKSVGVDAVFG